MQKNNTLPKIVKLHSIKFQIESGKTYFWCACGLSQNQPLCDGSHTGTGFNPVMFQATEDKIVSLCGCKYTRNAPFCDGFHKTLMVE